jgi:hypothetical protein
MFSRQELIDGMDRYQIPERMHEGMLRWIEDGIKPGSFLSAIIENDLYNAFHLADDENSFRISSYLSFFYMCAPGGCWRTMERVKEWEAVGGLKQTHKLKTATKDLFDEDHSDAGE